MTVCRAVFDYLFLSQIWKEKSYVISCQKKEKISKEIIWLNYFNYLTT